ncbi:hypothetical protein [Paraburkholderia caribensis]|uniref:hypothetical protein n=1 Tax=Paraburkholderia caribensis TaxID=75105 RepID=UPI001CAF89E7|nr:hypothetical protein [Paraburkholderia caribensis]CAG9255937.1 conserved hypothetical protein [Paraburkholderia caribensis]
MKLERVDWNPLRITYETADEDYRRRGNAIVIYAFRRRVEFALPELVKPYRRWVDTSRYQWATGPNDGYWDVHPREWGFSLHEGFLQVFFGPQTHDSTTTKSWCAHLPWTQWRYIRTSYHGLDGEHLRTFPERRGLGAFDDEYAFEKTVPKRTFRFRDYDGEEIEATTHIEEREWRFGEGWFKWLSLFRRAKVRRSLDIAFSKEVGRKKGSWKGGTIGHSIEMRDGELHVDAFARYCIEHNLEIID